MSENNNSQIGTMSVRGEDLPVFAYMNKSLGGSRGAPSGGFSTEVGGRPVYASTLEKLYAEAMNESRRQAVKVEVRFTTWSTGVGYSSKPGPRDGVATGFHSGSRKVMASIEGERAQQFDSYDVLRPLDAEEKAEWVRLKEAEWAAARARRAFEEERTVRLADAVESAVQDALTDRKQTPV